MTSSSDTKRDKWSALQSCTLANGNVGTDLERHGKRSELRKNLNRLELLSPNLATMIRFKFLDGRNGNGKARPTQLRRIQSGM